MSELQSEFLFEMNALVDPPFNVGPTPIGQRLVANVTGGTFEGPNMKGKILSSGADWLLVRGDGVFVLDVRVCLETDDGDIIYTTYSGRWVTPPELAGEMANPETAEAVDPSKYYFRTNPVFETGSEKYGWLNNIIAIGVGRRTAKGVSYRVHAIK